MNLCGYALVFFVTGSFFLLETPEAAHSPFSLLPLTSGNSHQGSLCLPLTGSKYSWRKFKNHLSFKIRVDKSYGVLEKCLRG